MWDLSNTPLQDTITNKALWPEFESRFGMREILVERFGQLAELRNCIRHSRTVDDVMSQPVRATMARPMRWAA
jgi:hypothetical protein